MPRKTIFMPVYNEIEYDGRVERAAEALGEHFDVTAFFVDLGLGYSNPKFRSVALDLTRLKRLGPLRYIYFSVRAVLHAVRMRPEIVHAHDYYMAVPGWIAARLSGARFVYDAHELMIPSERWPLRWRERFFYVLERAVVGRADLLIAASDERARLMAAHYRLPATALTIANITPPPLPVNPAEVVARWPVLARSSRRGLRMVYQGRIDPKRGVELFVQALSYLDDGFELVLVGAGPARERLEEFARAQGMVDRVLFVGMVPKEEVAEILWMCDVGIVTYRNTGLNNMYCAPNKVYEYAYAGLPMLATCQPPLKSLFEAEGIGEIVCCGDRDSEHLAREVAAAARKLRDGIDGYRAALRPFLERHNWEREKQKLIGAMLALSP